MKDLRNAFRVSESNVFQIGHAAKEKLGRLLAGILFLAGIFPSEIFLNISMHFRHPGVSTLLFQVVSCNICAS
jgi:hypothetical protein